MNKKGKYAIAWCMEYTGAVGMYADGGLGNYFPTWADWEVDEDDEFDTEEEARKVWEEGSNKHCIWDPGEFGADESDPEVAISYHMLVRYTDKDGEWWDVLEESTGDVTCEDIQNMYPDFDFETASKEYFLDDDEEEED